LKRVVFILISVICTAAQAQQDLSVLLQTTEGTISKDAAIHKIAGIVEPLQQRRLNDRDLLHKTFKRVNAVFLRKYEAYANFDELFTSGKYDCLTATALYSLVLDRLHFSYEIIETNYHIFLLVQTSKGDVLIETTDRFGGFVTGTSAIETRSDYYRANTHIANPGQPYLQYSFKLYQRISPANLNGLLYFNQAVKAFNQHMLLESSVYLEKANMNYSSPRCEELGVTLTRSVLQSSLDDQTKATCLSHLNHIMVRREIAGLD
jgi:hypothetical protein